MPVMLDSICSVLAPLQSSRTQKMNSLTFSNRISHYQQPSPCIVRLSKQLAFQEVSDPYGQILIDLRCRITLRPSACTSAA
jgi:hypothetical protein